MRADLGVSKLSQPTSLCSTDFFKSFSLAKNLARTPIFGNKCATSDSVRAISESLLISSSGKQIQHRQCIFSLRVGRMMILEQNYVIINGEGEGGNEIKGCS